MKINLEKTMWLHFDDAVVLISRNSEELHELLAKLDQEAWKIGLQIHPDETKWMKNEYCSKEQVLLKGNSLEEISEHVYSL